MTGLSECRAGFAALVLALCALSAPAWAQGYGLYEQGSCEMGRAGAGVAAPCDDGSAIFFNPAGLAALSGTVLSAGATAIAPRGQFTNSTTGLVSPLNERTFVAPTVYFARPVGHGLTIGLGVFAPYGLTTDWPSTTEGRFLGYLTSLRTVYVQPTVAVRLTDRVFVGGGVDITRMNVQLRRRVDLSTLLIPGAPGRLPFGALGVPPGTDFADIALTGDGVSVGGHLGAIVKAGDRLSIGARYLFRQQVEINDGQLAIAQIPTGLVLHTPLPGLPSGTPIDAVLAPLFLPGNTLGSQAASTTLPAPDQLVAGVALYPGGDFAILVDYQFTVWSLFDQVVIQNQVASTTTLIENYHDTHGVRVGVEKQLKQVAGGLTIRAGFDAHTAGSPDESVTPILPEAPRREFTVGATLPVSHHLRADVAYQFVHQEDRNGRTTDGGLAVPTSALNNGLYHYNAHLFGASLVIPF
jgi:long-chain fatty acid transport protein